MNEHEAIEVTIGREPGASIAIGRARVDSTNAAVIPIRIIGSGLQASGAIELGGWSGGIARLPSFFEDLATHWRGWSGTKTWDDDEGCISMSASHDGKSLVILHVEVRSLAYQGPGEWAASAEVPIEPGALDRIASEVRALASRDIHQR